MFEIVKTEAEKLGLEIVSTEAGEEGVTFRLGKKGVSITSIIANGDDSDDVLKSRVAEAFLAAQSEPIFKVIQ